jgi:ubiquinone/menaquinone biosynthesis C-methylase UbiE
VEAINSREIEEIYNRRAGHYNFSANLYYLIGFREWAYRKEAIRWLKLNPGDTVIEIGCGTGLNFSLLEDAVGPTGKIIGVDLTGAMLDQAEMRIRKHGWENVKLVHGNAGSFQFPDRIDGIISTFALSLMPDIPGIIKNGSQVLPDGKHCVVLDLKMPSNWLSHLWPVIMPIVKPFAVTKKHIEQRPWDIINKTFRENLQNVRFKELYSGFSFIIGGEA